jgi:hypothetical protein
MASKAADEQRPRCARSCRAEAEQCRAADLNRVARVEWAWIDARHVGFNAELHPRKVIVEAFTGGERRIEAKGDVSREHTIAVAVDVELESVAIWLCDKSNGHVGRAPDGLESSQRHAPGHVAGCPSCSRSVNAGVRERNSGAADDNYEGYRHQHLEQ